MQVRNSLFRRGLSLLLLASVLVSFSSCATKRPPQLISDGSTGRESQLPWNRQERWEGAGQAGALAEQLQGR